MAVVQSFESTSAKSVVAESIFEEVNGKSKRTLPEEIDPIMLPVKKARENTGHVTET